MNPFEQFLAKAHLINDLAGQLIADVTPLVETPLELMGGCDPRRAWEHPQVTDALKAMSRDPKPLAEALRYAERMLLRVLATECNLSEALSRVTPVNPRSAAPVDLAHAMSAATWVLYEAGAIPDANLNLASKARVAVLGLAVNILADRLDEVSQ